MVQGISAIRTPLLYKDLWVYLSNHRKVSISELRKKFGDKAVAYAVFFSVIKPGYGSYTVTKEGDQFLYTQMINGEIPFVIKKSNTDISKPSVLPKKDPYSWSKDGKKIKDYISEIAEKFNNLLQKIRNMF